MTHTEMYELALAMVYTLQRKIIQTVEERLSPARQVRQTMHTIHKYCLKRNYLPIYTA